MQAERYARDMARQGYRAGHYAHSFTTQAGEVKLRVPKLKGVTFESAVYDTLKGPQKGLAKNKLC